VNRKWLVAIVDDEVDIVNLFRESLGTIKGISVFAFTDPLAALEHFMINKNAYILIISDLRMPVLCGIELIKKIKRENPLVRTLLMTAFDVDDSLFDEYTKMEVINDFLQKPIRLNDLHVKVKKHLNIYRKNLKNRSKKER
jgi:DNA-binding NtrC family response regulator